jgi:glycosyltransferase involved in cell wall biosynthesis
MINAISVSLTKYNIDLICVGGGDFSSEEMDTFARLGIKDSVFQLDVSDADLIGLYRDSLALIMPSLYEGFGFPIIEAMSNACPVILNENSCFPEIAGNAGCYYEADNVISFQLTVSKILNDQDYRNNVITLGLDNAKKFTWENCVLNTSEAILNLNS